MGKQFIHLTFSLCVFSIKLSFSITTFVLMDTEWNFKEKISVFSNVLSEMQTCKWSVCISIWYFCQSHSTRSANVPLFVNVGNVWSRMARHTGVCMPQSNTCEYWKREERMEKSIFKKKDYATFLQVPLTNSVSCPAVSKRIRERGERQSERERRERGPVWMWISFQQLSVNLTDAALTMWCLWSVCGCLCVWE